MQASIHFPESLSAGVLSIAVISPDEQRRNAAICALGECQNGQIQEFISYPTDLREVSRILGNDFDVVIVDPVSYTHLDVYKRQLLE